VPSLILRLEQLARPDAPTAPADAAEPPAEHVDVPPPANTAVPSPQTGDSVAAPAEISLHDVDETEATPLSPPSPSDAPDGEHVPQERPARTVDLGAPERLTTATPLSRWSAAVAAAHDACFVVDRNGVIISVSVAAVELLGCGDTAVIGRHVLDVIKLVDLETGAANPEYAQRITPLVVLDGPGLGRSLIRVRHSDSTLVTLDTASVPVHDVSGNLLGSVTFLAPIPSR
jgi:PAS domain S-box-containing protein